MLRLLTSAHQNFRRGNQSDDRRLADETIILGVPADPEPQDPALDSNAEGAMMNTYSTRPETIHTFEMKRRVMGVSLKKLIFVIGQALDRG
jgi:hypothetical protein